MTCDHLLRRLHPDGICIACDREFLDYQAAIEELEAAQAAAAEELAELDRAAAFASLFEFVIQGWHVLEPFELEDNWHIHAICENLQGMFDEWMHRRNDRTFAMRWQKLLLNISPGTLKSRIMMVFFPAWVWLQCPSFMWLCVSQTPGNVTRDAEDSRMLVTSKWYRETFKITWTIRDDIDSKAKYATTAGGSRTSKSISTRIVGTHADGILCDDMDDPLLVHSDAERRKRAQKMEALSSRVNDKRHYLWICAQQRLHVDDNTGHLAAQGGWLHASYPLIYNDKLRKDTPFYVDPRSVSGQVLHELRFTGDVIAAIRVELGSYGFEAQHNQNPADLAGGMFKAKDFRFFRLPNQPISLHSRPAEQCQDPAILLELRADGTYDLDAVSITVDATFGTTNKTSDGVGLLVVGTKGQRHFIFGDYTKPMSYPEMKRAIRDLRAAYPDCTRIIVEKAAAGNPLIQDLELELGGMLGINPKSDKKVRAAVMLPSVEAGNIYLLEGAAWVGEFIDELCKFPNGLHDDRVDALSQLVQFFRESTAVQKQEQHMQAMAAGLRAMMG